jgi:hypothetical protein
MNAETQRRRGRKDEELKTQFEFLRIFFLCASVPQRSFLPWQTKKLSSAERAKFQDSAARTKKADLGKVGSLGLTKGSSSCGV